MSHKLKVSDGDWICSNKDCGNINFSRRSHCNKCGQGKDAKTQVIKQTGAEIGKGLASKSKGLFSAEDWQCGKCGNINWARRVTCNICNAPKFGAEEARTGLGGGYDERQDVEYIERDESDGEYDEFGRKKKRYREHPIGKVETRQEEEEEEEEEEEVGVSKYDLEEDEEEDDDDDVDLSKYDLSGSEEEEKSSNEKAKLKRRRSRSRSLSGSPKRKRSRSRSSSSSSSSSGSSRSSSSSSSSRSRSRSASGSPAPRRSRSPRRKGRANNQQS